MKGSVKGYGWASYVQKGPQPVGGAHNREPDRSPLNISGDGPYFRDRKLNRDPHGAPDSKAVIPNDSAYKRVDVFHHRAKDDD